MDCWAFMLPLLALVLYAMMMIRYMADNITSTTAAATILAIWIGGRTTPGSTLLMDIFRWRSGPIGSRY